MFETAELGQRVKRRDFNAKVPALREELLEAQTQLRESGKFPVLVLFAGVDGAGKGESVNLLNEWLDPRRTVTRAYSAPSDEERERPEFWRYWRDLPPKGHIGFFISAWYSRPLLDRVYGRIDDAELDAILYRIKTFERTLVDGGAVIQKYWMHLGREAQRRRFEALEADPLWSWRVTQQDWDHWEMYDDFARTAERILMRTSSGHAPWLIVEGEDHAYRSLKVGVTLRDAIARGLARAQPPEVDLPIFRHDDDGDPTRIEIGRDRSILESLDLSLKVDKKTYAAELARLQGRLNQLVRIAKERGVSLLLAFEGWDAAGKGGAIRRVTSALDARGVQVISIAAPTEEERQHHYLWRFWRHLSRAGRVTVFDRSWYGRVLVERVEGFATETEWRRSYGEINDFERELVDFGIVLVKFWIHITKDEQEERFLARQKIPYKRWKLTDEDWRNREKWDLYKDAVDDMIERTSTRVAPWVLVEGNNKRFARLKVLRTVCQVLEERLDAHLPDPDLPLAGGDEE